MADGLKLELSGFKELLESMAGLPAAAGARALAGAGRKAMKPVFDDTVLACSAHTGILRASLRLASTTRGSGNTGIVNAGVTVHKSKLQGEIEIADGLSTTVRLEKHADASWRWHFVEFGTSKMAAEPFLRPAFSKNVQTVLSILKDALGKNIARAWQRQRVEGV